ncbi:MAG: site-2 protease family protein, partial [Pseudomonadota bacterium]|nr:site-2 protease family protein [Pseudomonadota bacterium]
MNQNVVYQVAVWLIPLVIAIVFHEVAHGFVARLFGDRTAQDRGRLSLNPLRHVDPVGTIVVPMFLAIAHAPVFGWAKPVPVVANRMRNPRWNMALVALAGPVTNLVLAGVGAIALGWFVAAQGGALPQTGARGFVADNLVNFLLINVFLAI